MDVNQAIAIVKQEYKTDDIKFLGSGSDSIAIRAGEYVVRFSGRNRDQYKKEAAVCDFIRPNISVPIPDARVVERGDMFYVAHKMITGNSWSWHKFMYHPAKQRNLGDSIGRFMAQLHGVNVSDLRHAVPQIAAENIPYVDFDEMRPFFSLFMGRRRMEFFRKNYLRIINADVRPRDMTLIHMGIKGPNSVVDANGALCGVFDFCNCGVYERWREFALMYLCRNRGLYRRILSAYAKYSGVKPDKNRIIDLAVIEFMWEKRRKIDGHVMVGGHRFIKKNIAAALGRFYGLPRCFNWVIYIQLSVHQWFMEHVK